MDGGEVILKAVMRVGWWSMGLVCAAVVGAIRPQPSVAAMLAGAGTVPPSCRALLDGDPLEQVRGCSPGRIALTDEQVWVAGTPRSETGISWALGARVALQLTYMPRVSTPMLREERTDSVFTRLRIGF